MLRQVYLYQDKEIIYSYFFASAFTAEEILEIITKRLAAILSSPIDGQIFNKPASNYQLHYGVFKGVLFLFVSDMVDKPKTISAEMTKAVKLFQKNFPNPLDIKKSSSEREEFNTFIRETHYYLHPKIALIGSNGAGKTSVINLLKLKPDPDKQIMNFAVYYRIQLKDLFFDLWDEVGIKEETNTLWNNYIRGADVIVYLIDGSSLNERKDDFFMTLLKREGKGVRTGIILSHKNSPKFIGIDGIKAKYSFLSNFPVYEIDFTESDAKSEIAKILSDIIGLKKSLPPDFRTKLVTANTHVSKEEYEPAIKILEELSTICLEYSEFEYLAVFKGKIEELKEKLKAKKELEEQEKAKISAPKQIKFDRFKGVKTLSSGTALSTPGVKPLPTPLSPKPIIPSKISEKIPSQPSSAPEVSANPEQNQESLKTAEPDQFESSILSDMPSTNPFFGGIKPVSKSSPENIPNTIENTSVTPVKPAEIPDTSITSESSESSENLTPSSKPALGLKDLANKSLHKTAEKAVIVQSHKEMQKVSPIDIESIDKPKSILNTNFVEQIMQKSMGLMSDGISGDKKLTFERSPMIKSDVVGPKPDITQMRPATEVKSSGALDAFTPNKSAEEPSTDNAEVLGEMIRNLGESLSRELCQKFIEQIQVRLKKTKLTEDDLRNAAELYVRQRRKIQAEKK